jgi:hypothetical protein
MKTTIPFYYLLYAILIVFIFQAKFLNDNIESLRTVFIDSKDQVLEKNDKKLNACIVVLLRNSDIHQFAKNLHNFEVNFNHQFNYPYVLFNDQEFNNQFKETITKYTNSTIEFVKVASEYWSVPDWIEKDKLAESLKSIGFSLGYRLMCRFFSGFFFREKALLKYDYYWRLDADSE